ncbi:MAG TPA: PilZ domain-containing protein [bacterium]|nr:PilZ domain-containing protein [bacterium]
MYNNRERRKYKRTEKPYIARLRIKQYKGLERSSAEWDMVALKDLSAGGVLFNYNKNLGIGALLDLKIDVSTATPTIKCAGKVTRIEQSQPHYTLRIATEFTGIEEKGKEMINTAVEEILE